MRVKIRRRHLKCEYPSNYMPAIRRERRRKRRQGSIWGNYDGNSYTSEIIFDVVDNNYVEMITIDTNSSPVKFISRIVSIREIQQFINSKGN